MYPKIRLFDEVDNQTEENKKPDYKNALKELSQYFESGNSVDVERAIIKKSDFDRILKENNITDL